MQKSRPPTLDPTGKRIELGLQRQRFDIVDAGGKQEAAGIAEQGLQGLRPSFYSEKCGLLGSIATVRTVPIAVVGQLASCVAGNAPMGHFMKRASREVFSEVNPMRSPGTIEGLTGSTA